MTNLQDSSSAESSNYDPVVWQEMQRLHRLKVIGRWLVVGLLWLCLGPISLWYLRAEIALWLDYFTWTALRYGLAYNLLPTICLALCIGLTVSTLLWQSSNMVFGLSHDQKKHLEQKVAHIRQQGRSHPLWKWVIKRS
ncbi:hypothetical protein IQ268_07030 [Oculatella sp. LEGE 06141]|uniref:hypothetical protein n=1 Tax=Oculatella sp. LEGE 06141 TaxID=1828648 RepID=UPI0018800992|nr:hypothetical protein [Oculatella sp. LEGE 06141]MBE9178340.1 hypothetical protein [Oculatella sp. LEGE 06141]